MSKTILSLIVFKHLIIGFSERTLIHRNGSTRGDRKSNKQRTEIGTAKISLIIALVFIMCHLVKWVPNMHEIIMVRILIMKLKLLIVDNLNIITNSI